MDQRFLKRIQVDGAHLQYKRLGNKGLFLTLSKPVGINDLSKSGVSFAISERLDTGEPIMMKISFPDGKNLRLKGQIRWNREMDDDAQYRVGVQFYPFGPRRQYNPLPALDYLRGMEGQNILPNNNTVE